VPERSDEPINIMIVPGRAGQIRRISVPRPWIRRAGIGVTALALALITGAVDYVRVRMQMPELQRVREEAAEQRAEIMEYADRMTAISERFDEIERFDRKLRVITSLDTRSLSGVGGAEAERFELDSLSGITRAQRRERMVKGLDDLGDVSRAREESLAELIKHLESQTARLESTPSIAPAKGWMTSTFGYRESPFTGRREFHRGVDIASRMGTPIVAPANARVRFAGKDRALGNTVILRHGYGIETIYGHLAEPLVAAGDKVSRGDRIGLMGSTGRSTGPHLHFQVNVNGVPVNPQNYILD
jgi:murein DD-endopeptidase MepM/ murein hydrolase activator NlpD